MAKRACSKTCSPETPRRGLRKALLALTAIAVLARPVAAQDLPRIVLECPPGTIRPSVPFELNIVVSWNGDADSHVIVPPEPVFPESFSLRSSSFEATVSGSLHRLTYRFTLSARQPGSFRISPVEVRCWPRSGSSEVPLLTGPCTVTVEEPWPASALRAAGVAAFVLVMLACAAWILKRRRTSAAETPQAQPATAGGALVRQCRSALTLGDYTAFYTAALTAARSLLPGDPALHGRIEKALERCRFSASAPSGEDARSVLRQLEHALDRTALPPALALFRPCDTMRICAVILNYFGADDTIDCVRRLCAQPVARVCVVDNSADAGESARLTAACAAYDRVQVLATGENAGFAAGVNHCLRCLAPADFDAVLVLNNDTVIPDGFVEALSAGARTAGLQIAGPRIHHYPDTARLWSRGCFYNAWLGLVTHRSLFLPGAVFYVTGCCMLIQAGVFDAVGLFDERFFMYGEDVAFCARAAQAGLSIGVVEEALLFHKTSASAVNNSLFYEHQVARSHLLLSRCLFERPCARALSLGAKLPVLFLRAIARTLRFGNLRALQALCTELFCTRSG